jgi:hypothetical protein
MQAMKHPFKKNSTAVLHLCNRISEWYSLTDSKQISVFYDREAAAAASVAIAVELHGY